MKGYVANIEVATEVNEYFREVVFTGKHLQLVVMNLKPGEDIGMEVHETVDQFFRFEEGEGEVIMDGEKHVVKAGFGVVVPAGCKHNIVNTSESKELKLYTLYSPPNHPDGTIHPTKAEAEEAEAHEQH